MVQDTSTLIQEVVMGKHMKAKFHNSSVYTTKLGFTNRKINRVEVWGVRKISQGKQVLKDSEELDSWIKVDYLQAFDDIKPIPSVIKVDRKDQDVEEQKLHAIVNTQYLQKKSFTEMMEFDEIGVKWRGGSIKKAFKVQNAEVISYARRHERSWGSLKHSLLSKVLKRKIELSGKSITNNTGDMTFGVNKSK